MERTAIFIRKQQHWEQSKEISYLISSPGQAEHHLNTEIDIKKKFCNNTSVVFNLLPRKEKLLDTKSEMRTQKIAFGNAKLSALEVLIG